MADSVIVAFSIQQSQIINYLGFDIAAVDLLFYVGLFTAGTGKRQLIRCCGGIDQGVESILGIPSRFFRFSLDFTFHFLALLVLPRAFLQAFVKT
jgi:hypothetical protein